jgi:Pregnancy-associated plasma protein-A/Secretion system C-terminal sorting domain
MKKLLLTVFSAGLCTLLNAQAPERCHSHAYHQQQLAQHPELALQEAEINRAAEHFANDNPNGFESRAVVTIPVIFHVVYQNSTENISSARILEQLQVLNEDYRKLNSDHVNVPAAWAGLKADCEIQFCLAKRTPSNGWTNGIERYSTTTSSFSLNDDVKFASSGGANVWDRSKYLNIWVCDLGGGILGYAQFPGGPASTDGVVLDYRYTGKTGATPPYNKGRTATHEVGHYLGLYHIWGDDGNGCSGSDQISDTPNQASENYGCFNPGQVVTDNCTSTSPGVMWLNYMDYTDDACMYMFTTGQKTRMWSILNGSRSSLLSSNACTPVGLDEIILLNSISVYPSPSSGEVTIDFNGNNANDVDVTVFNAIGQAVLTSRYAVLTDSRIVLDLSGLASGVYAIEISNGGERTTRKVVIE